MNLAKGYWGSRSKVYTVAKNTVEKGLQYAYRDRKTKKREFRGLWIQRVSMLVHASMVFLTHKLMGKLNAKEVGLNRKVLADFSHESPGCF